MKSRKLKTNKGKTTRQQQSWRGQVGECTPRYGLYMDVPHYRVCRVVNMFPQLALLQATLRFLSPITWETHISTDVCSPTLETHIPSDT